MKKLSNKEKTLFIFLLIALVLAIFYNFLVYPKWKKNEIAQDNLRAARNNLEMLKSEDKIDNSADTSKTVAYENLEATIKQYAKDYSLNSFMQEQIILNLNDFAVTNQEVSGDSFRITKAGFKIENKYNTLGQDLSSSTESTELTEETEETEEIEATTVDNQGVAVEYLNVELEFYSSYDSLVNYIENVENYSKAVTIKNITLEPIIDNNPLDTEEEYTGLPRVLSNGYLVELPTEYIVSNGIVRGTMDLQFAKIPIINEYLFESELSILDEISQEGNGSVVNPFSPYSEFANIKLPEVEVEEEEIIEEDIVGEYIINNGPTYTTVYDFEEFDYFFVGKPTNVKGGVSLSNIGFSGANSAKLSYQFTKGIEESSANLVFTNTILINNPVENLGVEVYDWSNNPYIVGVVLRDSSGYEYEVDFGAYEESLGGWKKYYTTLPTDINYPVIVSRIYVRTVGEKTKLDGEILMDKLQVTYK